MDIKYVNKDGQQSMINGSDSLFARDYNEALVHQLVVAYQANARAGNRKQKTRAEVHHSTKKPFRQKGTGRARAGMSSSPLWRGGGRIFPNSPIENFAQKINRKMRRAGMAVIFSQLAREGRLTVVEEFSVAGPKTKLVAEKLRSLGATSALIVTDRIDENLLLGHRNLPNVAVVESHRIDPLSLLHFGVVILTKAAVAHIEEALA